MSKPCAQCGKPLRKWIDASYGYTGNGFFCSLRCGFRYAVLVKRAVENSPRKHVR